jgi:pyrimidine deaminase RibD-like protein
MSADDINIDATAHPILMPQRSFSAERNIMDSDRRFAEMALEEARKSKSEDARAHPLVGAVAVVDGEVLASAHRGECASGDHAEYTLLERKLKDAQLAGATVYTTLEPCIARNHPKVPCANRLAERRVKRVVIGMLDPNTKISGKGYQALRAAGIDVSTDFPKDIKEAIEELNREFIRFHTDVGTGSSLAVSQVELDRLSQRGLDDWYKGINGIYWDRNYGLTYMEMFAHFCGGIWRNKPPCEQ